MRNFVAMNETRARAVLAAAGLPADATLLALGENAVFGAGEVVVKIGRDAELLARAERELAVGAWLEESGVPAVRPAEPKPRLVEGHPVTVWHRLPDSVRRRVSGSGRAAAADSRPAFARVLASAAGCTGRCRPVAAAGGGRDRPGGRGVSARTPGRFRGCGVRTDTPPAARPDPRRRAPRNVHVGPDGPVVVDLETFSQDLREHDLVVMALTLDRYGLAPEAYESFTRAYGWDVREWDGCGVLRGARETASCAWVAQHAPTNPRAREEFARRVASLREGAEGVRWYAF